MKPCDQNLVETLEIVKEMILLADRGDEAREDTGCGILYGVLRDSAYKLKHLAEREQDAHRRKGGWRTGMKRHPDTVPEASKHPSTPKNKEA